MIFMCFLVDFLYARSGTLQIFSLLTYSLFFERMTREELRNVKRLPKGNAVMPCGDALQAFRLTLQVGETSALVHSTRKRSRPKTLIGQSLREDWTIFSKKLERSKFRARVNSYPQELTRLKVDLFNEFKQLAVFLAPNFFMSPAVPHRSPARQMGRWPFGHHRVAFERSPSCRPDHFIKLWNILTFKFSSVSLQLGFHVCFMIYVFFKLDWNTSWHVMTYQCKTW